MGHGEDSKALARFASACAALKAARVTLDAEGASITIDRPTGQRVLVFATEQWAERIVQLEDLAAQGGSR